MLEGEEGLFHPGCTSSPVDHRFLRKLQQLPNAIVTPHVAYRTERTLHDTVEATLTNCLIFERTQANAETQGRDPVRGQLGGA